MTDDTSPGSDDDPARSDDSTALDDEAAATDDGPTGATDRPVPDEVDDTPTVSCSRCDHEWDLAYELDEMGVGNQALEQFALDHRRHTGHFPDDVSTWRASCRHCPEESEHLGERAAVRWAKTHARHTRHDVELRHPADEERRIVDSESAL